MSGYRREPNWYLNDGTYNRLSRSAMLTLAHMAKLLNGGTWFGCVSTNRLVELTGLGRSSVCRAMTELRDAGIIARANGSQGYEILPDPRTADGTPRTMDGAQRPMDETGSAPPVAHERPTDGARAPHAWDSHSYRPKTHSKNFVQEVPTTTADGIRFNIEADAMVERTGFPKPDPKDQREIYEAVQRIRSGMYPECLGITDALAHLEVRLRWYWDEQAIRRANADRHLDEPSLAKTLREDRWRIDPEKPHTERRTADTPTKPIRPEYAKQLARLNARRSAS